MVLIHSFLALSVVSLSAERAKTNKHFLVDSDGSLMGLTINESNRSITNALYPGLAGHTFKVDQFQFDPATLGMHGFTGGQQGLGTYAPRGWNGPGFGQQDPGKYGMYGQGFSQGGMNGLFAGGKQLRPQPPLPVMPTVCCWGPPKLNQVVPPFKQQQGCGGSHPYRAPSDCCKAQSPDTPYSLGPSAPEVCFTYDNFDTSPFSEQQSYGNPYVQMRSQALAHRPSISSAQRLTITASEIMLFVENRRIPHEATVRTFLPTQSPGHF